MTSVLEQGRAVPHARQPLPTIRMFSTSAHVCEEDELWAAVTQSIVTRRLLFALSVNVHWLQLAAQRAEVAQLSEAFDLRLIDGKPIQVLASSALGHTVPKLSGADIVPAFCERSATKGWRIFFLGGAPGVAEQAAERARRLYPGCQIVGTSSPSADVVDDEAASRELCREIDATGADILLVAFGQPRQEQWIERHAHDLAVPVRVGVGASLDFLAGDVPRAPRWWQDHGLEWAWRIRQEPSRLWRRYLIDDRPMAAAVVSATLRNLLTSQAS